MTANRTVPFELNGKTYQLNYSLKARMAIQEKYGDIKHLFSALGDEDIAKAITAAAEVLVVFMESGARLAAINGEDAPKSPTADTVLDMLTVGDHMRALTAISEAIRCGGKPSVEVEEPDSKNA